MKFLGKRQDSVMIYNDFNVCLFLSFTEVLFIAGLEAITPGLPIMLSEKVSGEFSFGEKESYLPLEKKIWVDALLPKPMNLQRDKNL